MNEEQASEAMERTIISGGSYLEAGLSSTIARDLGERGLILPILIQMIGSAAAMLRVTTHASYRRAGGARPLLDRFLIEGLKRSGPYGEQVFGALAEATPGPVAREEL